MKRLVSLFVIAALILSLSGCGAATVGTTRVITQATTQATTKSTTEATTVVTTVATTKATTAATKAKTGERSSPAKVGESIGLFNNETELSITLNSVTRGKEAQAIALKENHNNKIPEGKELIIANITVMLSKYITDDDSSFRVSSWDFKFFNASYAEIEDNSVMIPDEYSGELYPGASITGNICIVVDEGTQNYARVYDKSWFDLSGK